MQKTEVQLQGFDCTGLVNTAMLWIPLSTRLHLALLLISISFLSPILHPKVKTLDNYPLGNPCHWSYTTWVHTQCIPEFELCMSKRQVSVGHTGNHDRQNLGVWKDVFHGGTRKSKCTRWIGSISPKSLLKTNHQTSPQTPSYLIPFTPVQTIHKIKSFKIF